MVQEVSQFRKAYILTKCHVFSQWRLQEYFAGRSLKNINYTKFNKNNLHILAIKKKKTHTHTKT